MWIFERRIAMKLQWILLLILTPWCAANLYPTVCTEDSQCSSGFYCEAGAHVCRQCILCSELHRESPPLETCVKSVGDCGTCVDGLVSEYEVVGGQCVAAGSRGSGLLPVYAWIAIGLSLVLIFLIIICLIFKTKTFKILYSSQTSVEHSSHFAPPPYNDVELASSPSSPPPPDDASLESSKLMELSHPCAPSPECPSSNFRLRENSGSQTARVYNNPSYNRLPQNNSSCDTSEAPISMLDDYESSNMSIMSSNAQQMREMSDNHRLNNNEAQYDDSNTTAALQKNSSRDPEIDDSNNNYSDEPTVFHRSNNIQYCSNMVAGPSFIINVLENINNIQQQS